MSQEKVNTLEVNGQRRKFLVGVSAVAAVGAAAQVLGSLSVMSAKADVSALLVSKVGSSSHSFVLRNRSSQAVSINGFTNGSIGFDQEIVDCNTACAERPIQIAPHQDVLVQFDAPASIELQTRRHSVHKAQHAVNRLTEGTRVVSLDGVVKGNAVVWV